MKKIILFILVFGVVELGRTQTSKPLSIFLQAHYMDGEKAFLEKIYRNINYPIVARESCRMGKLKLRLNVTQEGMIKEVGFLNEVGGGLEQEVIRVIKLVEKGWTKSETDLERSVDIVFAFQLGKLPEVKGDINVSVDGIVCNSNKLLLSRLEKSMKKERYAKAKQITEELLKRDPDSNKFRQLDKLVAENEKKEAAETIN